MGLSQRLAYFSLKTLDRPGWNACVHFPEHVYFRRMFRFSLWGLFCQHFSAGMAEWSAKIAPLGSQWLWQVKDMHPQTKPCLNGLCAQQHGSPWASQGSSCLSPKDHASCVPCFRDSSLSFLSWVPFSYMEFTSRLSRHTFSALKAPQDLPLNSTPRTTPSRSRFSPLQPCWACGSSRGRVCI